MKLNEDIAISMPTMLLVPYERSHVPRYHEWMQDKEIQELTASEPLSLPEEFANQVEWREAHDKLTFILCQPRTGSTGQERHLRGQDDVVCAGVDDDESLLLGDINFFIYRDDEDNEVDRNAGTHTDSAAKTSGRKAKIIPCYGEVDVMVAEEKRRGKGVGRTAVCALLVFIQRNLPGILEEYRRGETSLGGTDGAEVWLTRLVAKIKVANERSRVLFTRLGFEQRGDVNYFGEVELDLQVGQLHDLPWFGSANEAYHEVSYSRNGTD